MTQIEDILTKMRGNPKGIKFAELRKVCLQYFGSPRISASSHLVFRTPWPGDPRVNIQNHKGMAKAYQVRQVLQAVEMWEAMYGKNQ